MPETSKRGFLDGDLEKVRRSNIYWDFMNTLKAVMYAHNFAHFWVDRAGELKNLMRTKAPSVVGDWYRYDFDGFTITFSLSDGAIKQYQPIIREFSSFGTAVRILGTYEEYAKQIIRATIKKFPENIKTFSDKYKTGKVNPKSVKNLMSKKLGRGITLVEELFEYRVHPSYKPCINFFFELRNVGVHNSNVADERLCELAESEFIVSDGKIKIGDKVEWSLSSALQLNQLTLQILDEIDAVVYTPLGLNTTTAQRHWYYFRANGDVHK